jgi:hypothetical protein
MIEVIFYFGTDIVMVRIREHNITFVNSAMGAVESTIEGLKLSKSGAIKEYPDLKDRDDWKEESIKRFKAKIFELNDEEAIAEYIIMDLKKYGYVPKWKQKQGFRRVKIE